ncbi:hypothetical protein L1887_20564 [Cichorium endivia]|nr:hypothetical protein L1887_20564 [Cichorium endivia]
MEVIVPLSPTDSELNYALYGSAPSTPQLIGVCYFNAPTSPTRVTELYREFDEFLVSDDTQRSNSLATVPFAWEERPGFVSFCVFKMVAISSKQCFILAFPIRLKNLIDNSMVN